MAYKLYGLSKPNTFVSSFVKRAEGSAEGKHTEYGAGQRQTSPRDSSKTEKDNTVRVKLTSDINEKWEPSVRGLYSLCFKKRKDGSLSTKEVEHTHLSFRLEGLLRFVLYLTVLYCNKSFCS